MSFVVPVMEQEKQGLSKQSILGASVKAVSLALLGNRPNSRSIRPRAAKQYSNALKEVNHALKSQDLVLEDQTLAAVIILGIFEVRQHRSYIWHIALTIIGDHFKRPTEWLALPR